MRRRGSTATSWRISECIASAARSARYSLTNPRPTDAATITPMIRASSPSPTTADTAAAASNSHSNGLCSWRDRTDHALAWCERTAFGPNTSARADTSADVSPDCTAPERIEDQIRRHRRRRLDGWSGHRVHQRRRCRSHPSMRRRPTPGGRAVGVQSASNQSLRTLAETTAREATKVAGARQSHRRACGHNSPRTERVLRTCIRSPTQGHRTFRRSHWS